MKQIILFCLLFVGFFTCCASKENDIIQYKAVSLIDKNDTTEVYYTFTKDTLFIDEVGNEGFAYSYSTERCGKHDYLRFYDEVWECWYEYETIRKPNGDIVIKCKEGDILLEKQNKITDLGFN